MIAKIYQLFFQELIRYVTKMTCDKAAAEDIVQETFLRAMEHAVILDDMDERQCRSWLYKTSRNIFIDKVRRESACPEAEEKTETQESADNTGSVETGDPENMVVYIIVAAAALCGIGGFAVIRKKQSN